MESSLELFLLTLIDSGLRTPYDFQRQAGISVGASLPALRKLLRLKLILKGKVGTRRRMEYTLTVRGRAALRNPKLADKSMLEDIGSCFRLAIISNYWGSHAQVLKILDEARTRIEATTEPQIRRDMSTPAAAYRWMMSIREQHRRKADLEALRQIMKTLKEKAQ